jgi:hypothetical protein
MKNPHAKMVKKPYELNAYEVWQSFDDSWMWFILKKWQLKDDKPYARWFCLVKTPIVPEGEMGDVYVSEIKENATRIPDAVLNALKQKFTKPEEYIEVLTVLRHSKLQNYWYFTYAGMFHGIEEDGYIHT